jgi:Raf kinase inhibitor-like YbhB/YbcL family protein
MGLPAAEGEPMTITSPSFAEGQPMPIRHAHKNKNISPALAIASVPAEAKSLVLIVDDPDAPNGVWNHWLVWNIPPETKNIPEGEVPPGATVGKNDSGNARYDGPAPPSGTHRYFFKLIALDRELPLKPGSNRLALDAALKTAHVMDTATVYGTYGVNK